MRRSSASRSCRSTSRRRSCAPTRSSRSSRRRRRSCASPATTARRAPATRYTIGTGGSSVVALLRDHLAPRLIGRDPDRDRGDLEGPVLPHARDRGRRDHEPRARRDRHGAVGPALPARRAAAVEGGRRRAAAGAGLHDRGRLAAPSARSSWSTRRSPRRRRASAAPRSRSASRTIAEDVARLAAVRAAVGDAFEIMVDANQAFTVAEAIRRARAYRAAAARAGSRSRCRPRTSAATSSSPRTTSMPIAVGESLYHPAHFREYLRARAPARSSRSTARASAASRRGSRSRISPRRSTSPVCPHFLMELHVSLTAAVPNGAWVEYIPAARRRSRRRGMAIADGYAIPPSTPGPRHRLGLRRDRPPRRRARAVDRTDQGVRHADPQPRSPSACTRTTTS